MMDCRNFETFVKEKERMCDVVGKFCAGSCSLSNVFGCTTKSSCIEHCMRMPDLAIRTVQKWSDEHQLPEKKKRVQRGVAVIGEKETKCIVELEREVDPDNTIVLNGGSIYGNSSGTYSNSWDAQLELIDRKHIRATRAYPAATSCSVTWQVVELE